MHVFGPKWQRHYEKIAAHWQEHVVPEDIVLIPGDISWALKQEEVLADLAWIHALPGTKVMIRGNHDYWWDTIAKVRKILPLSIYAIGNDAITLQGIVFAGARLWDSPEYRFDTVIDMQPRPTSAVVKTGEEEKELEEKQKRDNEKVFIRELGRLKLSLDAMPKDADLKIVLTHYPPIGLDLHESSASRLIESYGASHVVFGHLHSIKEGLTLFGSTRGVSYHLCSCDYLDFKLIKIV